MSLSPASDPSQPLSLAELIPPRVLPRVLSRWDLIVIYVSVIYASYASGQMAGAGWQAVGIWILAYATFLVPMGMCSLEMGTLFPEEGGVYIWASKTMGKFWGFMGGWLSWMPVFGAVAAWSAIITSYLSLAFGLQLELWQQVGLQIGFVWLGVAIALLSLQAAQSFVNRLFYVYAGLSVLGFVAALVYAATHGSVTPLPTSWTELWPDLGQNGATFALAVLLLLGVETPFNMGVEIKSVARSAPWMVFGGSFLLGLFYLLTTIAVLLTTPLGKADPYTAVAMLYQNIGWGALMVVAGLMYVVTNLTQTICYQYSYSRLLFVSGVEKHLPKVFAYLDPRTRTPVAAILLQGAIISLIVLVMYSNTNLAVATQVMIAALTVIWCASSYFFVFPVLVARRRYAHLYADPVRQVWQIPGGLFGAWLVVFVATISNTLAIYYCFAAPWVPDLPVSQWAPQVGTVAGVALLIGIVIYFWNLKQSSSVNVEDELAKYAVLDPGEQP